MTQRNTILLTLLTLISINTRISGLVQLDIPYLECEISLSKSVITAGEPVDVCFYFTNTMDGMAIATLMDDCNIWTDKNEERNQDESLVITIRDSAGNEVKRRNLLCRTSQQSLVRSEICNDLKKGETVEIKYPLHLRTSTLLAPGKYCIAIKQFMINYGRLSPEDSLKKPRIWHTQNGSYPGPSLELEITSGDKDALVSCYDSLMKNVGKLLIQSQAWGAGDYHDVTCAARTILWAEGPVAVPYQIDLLYDSDQGFRLWPPTVVNTWGNIVNYADVEQIKRVLEMAEHPEFLEGLQKKACFTSRYDPGLVWAIRYWYQHGSEEVRDLIRDLAEVLPDMDPCPLAMRVSMPPCYGD